MRPVVRPAAAPAAPAATPAAAVAQDPQQTFTEKEPEPAPIDALLTITTSGTPAPTPATTEAVVEDLTTRPHDIDIPLNPKVLSYVELFSGRLKDYIEDGLNRGTRYLPMIEEVFRDEGVPLDLAYVPLIESAFKPSALSRAKAKGIWQFMRGTGLENGLKHDWYIDERADPEKATRAAARYLKTLHGMFGDWHLALASYNGGPGRVQRALKRSGKDDFWTLTATSAYLPRETRDYVPLILAAVIVAKNPAQYGLVIDDPANGRDVESVALDSPVDLRQVASWLGVELRTIQDLNPELRRWMTPLRDTDYELKVPAGSGDIVRARLLGHEPAELAPVTLYTVKKGDTLLSVAKKLKVTRADLAEANYLKTNAKVQTGQRLVIPRAPALDRRFDGEVILAVAALEPTSPAAGATKTARTVASTSGTARNAEVKVVHRVKSGETLTSIAKRYGTSVSALKQWNKLQGSMIQAGQRLTIMSKRSAATD